MGYVFKVTIELGSDALDGESLPGELSRILSELSARVADGWDLDSDPIPLRDINGNRVGTADAV